MLSVSPLAALAGALAGFTLGAVWYGPLFGRALMAENGFTSEGLKAGFNPAAAYGATFALALVAAFAFGVVVGPAPGFGRGVGLGLGVGLCLVAGSIATNFLFERRSLRLLLIHGGYHAMRFALIGAAFGLLG